MTVRFPLAYNRRRHRLPWWRILPSYIPPAASRRPGVRFNVCRGDGDRCAPASRQTDPSDPAPVSRRFEQRTGQADASLEVPNFPLHRLRLSRAIRCSRQPDDPASALGACFRVALLRAGDAGIWPRSMRFCATPCPEFTMNNR
jgi:hypothetical protein